MKIIFGSAGNLGFNYRCGDSDYFGLAGFVYADDSKICDRYYTPTPGWVVASVVHKRLINSRALRADPGRLLHLAIGRALENHPDLKGAELYFAEEFRALLPEKPAKYFFDNYDFVVFAASSAAADLVAATRPFTSEIDIQDNAEKSYITKVDWPLS